MTEAGTKTYRGGCHCGAVRFEVELDLSQSAGRCNCSICQKLGRTGLIAKPDAFRLVAGEAELTDYRFGTKSGRYRFCKHCGVHSFGAGHLEQLGGDYVSVNLNCLDDLELESLSVVHWDGRHDNWMAGPRDRPWPLNALEG